MNPHTGQYDVKHQGSYAGRLGQKPVFATKPLAMQHAVQYIRSLHQKQPGKQMHNFPSASMVANRFGKQEPSSVGSSRPVSNASQDMSHVPGAPITDPQKTKAFVQGFKNALGGGTTAKSDDRMTARKMHKRLVSEPLMKPYVSEAQRRWAHTDAGKKALGGDAGVRHWDKESAGKKLPEHVSKAEPKAKPAAPAQTPAAAPEPFNPKLERPNQRARVKDYLSEMKADPSKHTIDFSTSNSKLSKDGIISFNLPAVETCPGAGKCAKYCYADTGSFLRFYKTTMPPRVGNWLSSQRDDFPDRMIQHLRQWKDTGKNPKDNKWFPFRAVRIHDSGDFYSPKYIDHWTKIARELPDVQFYAYTKSHHPALKNRLKELAGLPNVNIVQSLGSKYDHLVDPDQPHAVVFESPEQMKEAGYTDAMASDLPASDKRNTRIGLYIHGSSKGKFEGLDEQLAGNPELRSRIMGKLGRKP